MPTNYTVNFNLNSNAKEPSELDGKGLSLFKPVGRSPGERGSVVWATQMPTPIAEIPFDVNYTVASPAAAKKRHAESGIDAPLLFGDFLLPK